jgi:hypothetical protein
MRVPHDEPGRTARACPRACPPSCPRCGRAVRVPAVVLEPRPRHAVACRAVAARVRRVRLAARGQRDRHGPRPGRHAWPSTPASASRRSRPRPARPRSRLDRRGRVPHDAFVPRLVQTVAPAPRLVRARSSWGAPGPGRPCSTCAACPPSALCSEHALRVPAVVLASSGPRTIVVRGDGHGLPRPTCAGSLPSRPRFNRLVRVPRRVPVPGVVTAPGPDRALVVWGRGHSRPRSACAASSPSGPRFGHAVRVPAVAPAA